MASTPKRTARPSPLLYRAGGFPNAGATRVDGAFVKAASQLFYDLEPSIRTLA